MAIVRKVNIVVGPTEKKITISDFNWDDVNEVVVSYNAVVAEGFGNWSYVLEYGGARLSSVIGHQIGSFTFDEVFLFIVGGTTIGGLSDLGQLFAILDPFLFSNRPIMAGGFPVLDFEGAVTGPYSVAGTSQGAVSYLWLDSLGDGSVTLQVYGSNDGSANVLIEERGLETQRNITPKEGGSPNMSAVWI